LVMSRLDGRVPPLPFPDPSRVDLGRLRVGFFTHDGIVPPSAAVARAVERASNALGTTGVRVCAFTPPRPDAAIDDYFAALSADGGATVVRQLEGGAVHPALASLRKVGQLSPRTRSFAARAAGLAGQRRLQRLLTVTGKKPVEELWRITQQL